MGLSILIGLTFGLMKTRTDTFWELSQQGLQEDFEGNESLALSYLNWKFGEDVTDEICDRIHKTLIVDWKSYDT